MDRLIPKLPHAYAEGDQLPAITGFIEETDLTGYAVTLRLQRPDGSVVVKAGTLVDAASGMFSFAWAAGDLLAGAGQLAEVEFKDGSNQQLTSHKFTVDVEGALG